MSMDIILGKPRRGKGAYATMLIHRRLEHYAKKGMHRRVYANFPVFDDRVTRIDSFDEVQELADADVFLDEFANWFGRRSHSKTSDEDLSFFRQHGHHGLYVCLIFHYIEDAETKIVEICDHVYEIKRVWGPDPYGDPTAMEERFGWIARVVKYDAREFLSVTRREVYARESFNIEDWIHQYDSFWIVGLRDGTGAGPGRKGASAPSGQHRLSQEVYDACRMEDEISGNGVSVVRWVADAARLNDAGRGTAGIPGKARHNVNRNTSH